MGNVGNVGNVGGLEERRQAQTLEGLLRVVRHQASRGAEPDVTELLDWLHRQSGAEAALITDGEGGVESSTAGFPRGVLRPLAALLERLSSGRLAAAATHTEGLHVRCEALGPHEPRPVLVVAGSSEPTAEAVRLMSHTGLAITLLLRAGASDRVRHDYHRKARQLRFAVLHALLRGDPLLARRMTTGSMPPLLDSGRLRVHVLHCPTADRDRIERAHQDASGYHGQDLMVQCPVFKEHLICLIADDEEASNFDDPTPERGEVLHRLVRDNPGYALGISGVHPLSGTSEGYSQALHALAAARTTPGHTAFYHGRTPLEGVLSRQPALDWARGLLRPLDSVPKVSTDITRLIMSTPRSGVARLLGLSRNTVTAHIRRTERALGSDLTDVRSRAAVHLALALNGSCAGPDPGDRQPSPVLDDLLNTERAASWARTVLRPLDDRHRRTLQGWIDANTDAQEAARRMGLSRNTVRAHVRTAESLLGLDLLTTGAGVHDVVHALRITAVRAV